MLRTIMIGTCVSVQGIFVKTTDNGKVIVQVGNKTFEGDPVKTAA